MFSTLAFGKLNDLFHQLFGQRRGGAIFKVRLVSIVMLSNSKIYVKLDIGLTCGWIM